MLFVGCREVFDCVAECCSGHGRGVTVEEGAEACRVAFAAFADPSADGFLDEGFMVVDEELRYGEGVVEVVVADEVVGRDDRRSSLPLTRRCGEGEELGTWPVVEVAPMTDGAARSTRSQLLMRSCRRTYRSYSSVRRVSEVRLRRAWKSMIDTAPTRWS
jgi:hypothetical protein